MEKEFISYPEALALKELGFDEQCIYYVDKENEGYIYNFQCHPDEFIEWCACDVIKAPLWQQAFRWFRKKYKLDGFVEHGAKNSYDITIKGIGCLRGSYKEYEDAQLECLKKLIEIVKTKDEDFDEVNEYLMSKQFLKDFAKQVEADTWGKGLPKIYMDKDGNIVEHWKDGTINIIKEK